MAIPPPKRKQVSDAAYKKKIASIAASPAHRKKIDKWDKQITEALRLLKNPPIAPRTPNQRVPAKVRKWAPLTKLIDENYPARGKNRRQRK